MRIILMAFAILILSCSPKPSFEVAKTLFEEIVEADSTHAEKVICNNWVAFDVLGKAFEKDSRPSEYYGLFTTFFMASTNRSLSEANNINISVALEYMGNLIASTRPGGIVVVSGDENYYLARFIQEIDKRGTDIAVINLDYLGNREYQKYIKKHHGIILSRELIERISKTHHKKLLHEIAVKWLIEESGRSVFLGMEFPILPFSESYLVGPGRLYSSELTPKTHKEFLLSLFAEGYSFKQANKNWDKLSSWTQSMIRTYSDGLNHTAISWFEMGDTVSAESLSVIAFERLEYDWQPVKLYFVLHGNLGMEELNMLIMRVERYLSVYPDDRRAVSVLADLKTQTKR
ncbi:hypothetical protein KAH81_09705 [bacterium]|nr:hypothetical protein [bacterium]